MPINNATLNFGFMHLDGDDTASHNGINALITDIDTEIYARVAVPGMMMLFYGGAAPTGWAALSGATTPTATDMNTAFGTPPSGVIWIKKDT